MTHEESMTMWEMERSSMNPDLLSETMKKLFDKVEVLIKEGKLMYDQFSGDMLDAVTTMIIDNSKTETGLDRAGQVDYLCKKLYEKYTEQYNDSEPGEGDNGVSVDSIEVSDESGVCESEDTSSTSIEHTTEIE